MNRLLLIICASFLSFGSVIAAKLTLGTQPSLLLILIGAALAGSGLIYLQPERQVVKIPARLNHRSAKYRRIKPPE